MLNSETVFGIPGYLEKEKKETFSLDISKDMSKYDELKNIIKADQYDIEKLKNNSKFNFNKDVLNESFLNMLDLKSDISFLNMLENELIEEIYGYFKEKYILMNKSMTERYGLLFKIDSLDEPGEIDQGEDEEPAFFFAAPVVAVSYGAVLYTVFAGAVAMVGAAVKFWGTIQDKKDVNKEIWLLNKLFPELRDILNFIYEEKGIIYSKKLFEYIIKSSLDEVSSNIKGKIFEKCNVALV